LNIGDRGPSRASGVLLHPTSLWGVGIGDLGNAAHEFVDWLASAGQSYWQILPLVPVDYGGSPYNGLSAMAGNPLLISPALLEEVGLLGSGWEQDAPGGQAERVDYGAVAAWKESLLRAAHHRFIRSGSTALHQKFEAFRAIHHSWLPDYALFMALREHHGGGSWAGWPEPLKRRDQEAIERWATRLSEDLDRHAFGQFLFEEQWSRLRSYANARGIRIVGDIPIFVAHDSADVWAHPEIFQLDEQGSPTVVAGVPPDYFSATGQRWGNPLYRWDTLATNGYGWWVDRFRRAFQLVDTARIDHFRGFEAYWEIDATEPTAVNGKWIPGPGAPFFRVIEQRLGRLPLIAEDLGLITAGVEQLRDELGYPGMRVLQFAFDGDPRNPHLPANYVQPSVAYTGTHDNDTILGWWSSAGWEERSRVLDLLGGREPDNWSFIEMIMSSRAGLTVVPLQDVLGFGREARMNTPGEPAANWAWRINGPPADDAGRRLRALTEATSRMSSTIDSPSPANELEVGR